jgi:ABC-2 type transport system permease protein
VPQDTLFGRWVRESGFATPLLVLGFAAQWAFPFLTSVVAGDMFSAEDHHGTWKTILTRSRSRGEVFTGKVLAAATFTVAVVAALGLASLAAGVLLVGRQPLVGLSGTLLPPGHATLLVLASWATAIPPALGFTAVGLLLSAASRHTAVGVVGPVAAGLLMQLYAALGRDDVLGHLTLTMPLYAWHGFFVAHPFYGPLLEGTGVCTVYLVGCLAAAWWVLRRRDETGG